MGTINQTPSADRIHIAFFGRRNAGKSSLVNAVTGQELSIVSDRKGTTTDPVTKSMELLPLGPVVIIDTPGIDDEGKLGELRVKRARQVLNRTDVAILVVDATAGMTAADEELLALFRKKGVPYLIAYNKSDLLTTTASAVANDMETGTGEGTTADTTAAEILVSALRNENIYELKEKLAALMKDAEQTKVIVGDLLREGDHVILVTPIDSSAPKGRMILPQVRVIRDILDVHATCSVTQVEELAEVLSAMKEKPRLVITDSQAFGRVKELVPEEIPLTSFSILFARYKGVLETAIRGAAALKELPDGARILISEGCTHHRQCEDIGTVKLPGWIQKFTGKELTFSFTSGGGFPEDLSPYSLIIHCGGCMLNEREMRYRERFSQESEIPYTNYGTVIACMNGILERSLAPFEEYANLLSPAAQGE